MSAAEDDQEVEGPAKAGLEFGIGELVLAASVGGAAAALMIWGWSLVFRLTGNLFF